MGPNAAPGRPGGRSGACLFGLIGLVALLAGGCDAIDDAIGGGSSIALDSADISIAGDVHEIRVSGAGARDSIAPGALEATSGDALRFMVEDRRPHAFTFTESSLAEPVREYLERTGQLRGPPLVNEGSEWVVILEDAPPGRYPFHCRSHDARGEITVVSSDD